VIQYEADILDGKEPGIFRCVGAIKNGVSDTLDVFPSAFGKVLVLHECLALPIHNVQGTKDFFDACTGFDGSMVTEEATCCTLCTDVILKSVRELLFYFHTTDVTDEARGTTEELSHGGAVVDSWGVRVKGIRGNVFLVTGHVDGRVGRFKPFAEDVSRGNTS
jgi:hypothetical protein